MYGPSAVWHYMSKAALDALIGLQSAREVKEHDDAAFREFNRLHSIQSY